VQDGVTVQAPGGAERLLTGLQLAPSDVDVIELCR
jgi:hypothetical protein